MKVSKKYWDGLREIEKEFIRQRIQIDGLQDLKSKISIARKTFGIYYAKIYGKGFVELENGETYLYSGSDTKKYHKVN